MCDKCVCSEKPVRIVILQRGWVFVGRLVEAEGCDELQLVKAHCIRRWGTTKGLGELANDGPLSNTVLEPAGTVRFHRLTVVAMLDAKEAKWAKTLA